MKIEKIKINNFGKLENKEIELDDGINIIYGKNESGKTTLLKFITAMFYGANKNKNGKAMSDYDKYTPWNEKEFSGKIQYKLENGEEYEVYREFKKKNPIIYNSEKQDISKTFTIDKTKGNQYFYEQTKTYEELFVSSIVSNQQEVKLDSKSQNMLVQKTANIIATGEDDVSYNKIINKLNKRLQEEVGTEKSPTKPLNMVRQKIEKLKQEKEYLEGYSNKKYEIEENKEKTHQEIGNQEKSLEVIKKIKEQKQQEELEIEKVNVKEKILSEYDKKIEEINNQITEKRSKKIEKKDNNKLGIVLTTIMLLVAILTLILVPEKLIGIGLIFITIVLAILVFYKSNINKKNYQKECTNQNDEINKLKNEIEALEVSKEKQKQEIKQETNIIKEKYKEIIDKLTKEYTNNTQMVLDTSNVSILNYKIENMQNSINQNKLKIHQIELDKENIMPKIENLITIQEELENLQEELINLKEKESIILIAKDAVEGAYKKMKETITPAFTVKLSENISKISDGKYKNVKFDEEKGLIVEAENGKYISAESLSVGTIEQLYLSLRLSTQNEIEQEPLPIILDETFAYFDKERLKNTLEFLKEEFKNRQIIILTCTNREKEILEELKFEFNLIEI